MSRTVGSEGKAEAEYALKNLICEMSLRSYCQATDFQDWFSGAIP
jgi:hypothetical protein